MSQLMTLCCAAAVTHLLPPCTADEFIPKLKRAIKSQLEGLFSPHGSAVFVPPLLHGALAQHTHTHTHTQALARGVETFGYGYLVAEDKLVRLFFDADLLYRRKKRLWLLVTSFE